MSRNIHFGLMLNEHEREALDRLADAEGGLSRAATIRRLIRVVACAGDLWPEEDARRGEASLNDRSRSERGE